MRSAFPSPSDLLHPFPSGVHSVIQDAARLLIASDTAPPLPRISGDHLFDTYPEFTCNLRPIISNDTSFALSIIKFVEIDSFDQRGDYSDGLYFYYTCVNTCLVFGESYY